MGASAFVVLRTNKIAGMPLSFPSPVHGGNPLDTERTFYKSAEKFLEIAEIRGGVV